MKTKELVLFLLALLAFGCAPKVDIQVTMPAKAHEATEIKKVAVFSFDGNYGKQASVEIENVLASADVKGQKYFTVVDRQNIQRVMSEQKFQTSGIVDENTAVKLGKLIGAEGVYIGTANISNGDERYSEQRSKCISRNSKGKCLSYSNYNVSCTKRTVGLTIIPKLIHIATGQVKYTSKLVSTEDAKRCSDSSSPLPTKEQLAEIANYKAMKQFREEVAPYETTVYIEVLEKTDGITDNPGRDSLKYSVAFAKKGRLDRACDIWRNGAEKYHNAISFVYNVGICYEAEGNLKGALEQYMKADKMTIKPEDAINKAIARVKQRIADNARLNTQIN